MVRIRVLRVRTGVLARMPARFSTMADVTELGAGSRAARGFIILWATAQGVCYMGLECSNYFTCAVRCPAFQLRQPT